MPANSQRRPDPEQLLQRIQAQESEQQRGRLKIFLGYASRVGKSFRMLDEGRRRKQRGQDVVVGAVQPGLTPDAQELLHGLDTIPTLSVEADDKHYDVLDVATILRRRPQICLVDGLAYDNPPGSRNPQRWQDVQELLDNGITVVTSVNLQHIAERQNAVEKIVGKRASQSVPEKFVRTADEIVLVDAPPEDLQRRDPSGPGANARHLSELRELALLLAAEVVEDQLQRYLQAQGIDVVPASQERVLVCVTPRSNAPRMLEAGRHAADRFHCDLLALYVRQKKLTARERASVDRHLALARSLGAKVEIVESDDSAGAIVEFTRAHRVTQLFVGHSQASGWRSLLSRSPLDRVIAAAENMDLRIFPQQPTP